MFLFARHDLVSPKLSAADPAVLLEGSWPPGTSWRLRGSLDDEIDSRFQWIDAEASRLVERLGEPSRTADRSDAAFRSIHFAWLNALGLRYHLVKLIRMVVYFTEVRPPEANEQVQLVVERGRDDDYVDCARELCRLSLARLSVQSVNGPDRSPPAFPANPPWRRKLAGLLGRLEPRRSRSPLRRRVVLCGNPRLLDPVCRELVRRDASVFWLYDRFSLRSWLRWRARGAGQLVCDSSQSRVNRLLDRAVDEVTCRGVNLREPVGRWIAERLKTHGARQTRVLERIDDHFRRLRPDALVLDEDATPLARAAVGLARLRGAASFVVQHGAPLCQFGFSPLAADGILAWGRSSQEQLVHWGVPSERIHVVGSAKHEAFYRAWCRGVRGRSKWNKGMSGIHDSGLGVQTPEFGNSIKPVSSKILNPEPRTLNPPSRPNAPCQHLATPLRQRALRDSPHRRPRFLLLATVPPRDDRPDAVALHLNRRTYAEMLRMALAVVATIPDAELIVKLHPRTPDDPIAHAAMADFPSVESRVVDRGPLKPWLARTDCVLSCISSAGVDSTLTGVPVIQLLPPGSGDVLPHQPWGMLGTARTEAELQQLVTQAKKGSGLFFEANPNPNTFSHLDGLAAERIADVVLARKREDEVAAGSASDERRVDREEPVSSALLKRSRSTRSERG